MSATPEVLGRLGDVAQTGKIGNPRVDGATDGTRMGI
eukprot:CAMPEP_0117685694 /NCGR_PEP_ID=MMETSP0804-20121206/21923_1 /TAXON_ID=1074897 /ORGANISM="Tetraselmis astigmatica, Strain CCMP880" /LENGTH=36 /DNA_ID= /DNA_START= /DNA_END= /DNA_ORIENTATION=